MSETAAFESSEVLTLTHTQMEIVSHICHVDFYSLSKHVQLFTVNLPSQNLCPRRYICFHYCLHFYQKGFHIRSPIIKTVYLERIKLGFYYET